MEEFDNRKFWLLLVVAAILLTTLWLKLDYADRRYRIEFHSEITDTSNRQPNN